MRFEEGELREYIRALKLGDLFNQPMLKLLHQFEEAKNLGSLIQPCLTNETIACAAPCDRRRKTLADSSSFAKLTPKSSAFSIKPSPLPAVSRRRRQSTVYGSGADEPNLEDIRR